MHGEYIGFFLGDCEVVGSRHCVRICHEASGPSVVAATCACSHHSLHHLYLSRP